MQPSSRVRSNLRITPGNFLEPVYFSKPISRNASQSNNELKKIYLNFLGIPH